MYKMHISDFVKEYLKENINKEDIVVDATIGNGHDTLFLSDISKFVYGFDIQQQALTNTTKLLESNNKTNYKLFLKSHEYIYDYVSDFKGVVFNLGYLPNSDKSVTTTKETTVKTLTTLTTKMNSKTFIIITCYIGHEEGKIEAGEVLKFASNLDNSFSVLKYEKLNSNNAPYIVLIEKN